MLGVEMGGVITYRRGLQGHRTVGECHCQRDQSDARNKTSRSREFDPRMHFLYQHLLFIPPIGKEITITLYKKRRVS